MSFFFKAATVRNHTHNESAGDGGALDSTTLMEASKLKTLILMNGGGSA